MIIEEESDQLSFFILSKERLHFILFKKKTVYHLTFLRLIAICTNLLYHENEDEKDCETMKQFVELCTSKVTDTVCYEKKHFLYL